MRKKARRNLTDTLLAQNRKARYNYQILDTLEAGLSLKGTEIKSVRQHRLNIQEGFVKIYEHQVYLENVNINEYAEGNQFNHDPFRSRKLLLHKVQIKRLEKQIANPGMTIVPLKVYLKNGFAKVLIGVGKGKREFDKRDSIKKREQERDIARSLKH